jgi:hypothetical protein
MSTAHVTDAVRPVNPEPPLLSNFIQMLGTLRDFDFLTFEQLMDKLPDSTSREAIRKLERERGLPAHRIGKTKFYYVRELIAASAVGPDDQEE